MDNNKKSLKKLNLNETEIISAAGEVFPLSNLELRNALNYYISFLPGTSRKHYKKEYEISSEWNQSSENICERTIKERIIRSDMKWSELNRREKIGVIVPLAFFGFVCGFTALGAVSRNLKKSN